MNTHPIDLVIDAGANTGQFGRLIRRKGYRGRIWSFEPVSYVYEALAQNISRDPLWRASRVALGSEQDEAQLNVSVNHTLSSFLSPTGPTRERDPLFESVPETVVVETIDRLLADDPAQSIFLKADVQGFEKQVLEGARETLKRTHALYLELPGAAVYEGEWTFAEAINYLDALGFTPAQFRTVGSIDHDRASAVQFDCLLRRKS